MKTLNVEYLKDFRTIYETVLKELQIENFGEFGTAVMSDSDDIFSTKFGITFVLSTNEPDQREKFEKAITVLNSRREEKNWPCSEFTFFTREDFSQTGFPYSKKSKSIRYSMIEGDSNTAQGFYFNWN
jgi:hypothetical protein